MDLINTIQQNMATALLFWTCFISSIIISHLYQKRRVKYINGSKIERPMSKILQVIWISFIVLAPTIIVGIRHFNVGADTFNYWIGFLNTNAEGTFFQNFKAHGLIRPLFFILQYLVFNIFGENPTVFLIFIAFITLYTLVKALDKWKMDLSMPFSLFVYYSIFGMQLLNQSRQLLALSIFFLAITYLMKNQRHKFYIYIGIASLIHYSALIGLIAPIIYFSKNKYSKIKKWIYYIAWALSPFLISPVLKLSSKFITGRYTVYFTDFTLNDIGFGLILNILPVFLPILLFKKYLKKDEDHFLIRVAYLTFPFRLAGYYSYFLMRLYYYGAIVMVIIIPVILKRVKYLSNKLFVSFIMILICIFYYIINYMYVNSNIMFPYYSIFTNGY